MQRRLLIIDDHNDLAEALEEVFSHAGQFVETVETRTEAIALGNMEAFDLVITDLDVKNVEPEPNLNGDAPVCLPSTPNQRPGERLKVFKICAVNFRRDEFDEDELKNMIATILDYKIRFVDKPDVVQDLRELIEFELPSVMSLMYIVLEYLLKRVEKLGVVNAEQSNLFVALDEAFVNAVKHGNKFDTAKLIRVSADVTNKEARFTIEDEGEGFDIDAIPNPLDPDNLFKSSGRGVLFIYNIMDEVKYNDRGNRLTMVKKADDEHQQKA